MLFVSRDALGVDGVVAGVFTLASRFRGVDDVVLESLGVRGISPHKAKTFLLTQVGLSQYMEFHTPLYTRPGSRPNSKLILSTSTRAR